MVRQTNTTPKQVTLNKSNFSALYKKIEKAIHAKDVKELKLATKQVLFADLSDVINKLPETETLFIVKNLDAQILPKMFVHLDVDTQKSIIDGFNNKELNELFAAISHDDLIDIVYIMPKATIKKIKSHLTDGALKKVIAAEETSEDSIGLITKPNFVTIREGHTLGAALETMRAKYEKKEIESFALIYVHDKDDKLIGFIRIREFLFGDSSKRVEQVMLKVTTALHPGDTFEKAAQLIGKYKLPMMPVINQHGQQIGIALSSDIASNVQEKATKDIRKMSAVSTGHGAASEIDYDKASIYKIYRSRIVWIVVLMIAATFTQVIMEDEHIFGEKFLMLIAPVIPLLMGTAGNAGGQASSTITRSLSLGEISTKDYFKVVWKELRVAFAVGLTVFAVNAIRMIVIRSVQGHDIAGDNYAVIWMSGAMFTIVILAKFLGASMPILAKKFKLDPAVVAGPLIMTFIDLLSVVIMLFWFKLFS